MIMIIHQTVTQYLGPETLMHLLQRFEKGVETIGSMKNRLQNYNYQDLDSTNKRIT